MDTIEVVCWSIILAALLAITIGIIVEDYLFTKKMEKCFKNQRLNW